MSETPPVRISCCVPFCRRTARRSHLQVEWVCGGHWTHVPRLKRAEFAAAKKECRKSRTHEAWVSADALWLECKAAAIEAAAGI